ncbi:hypothetical protein B0H17DRAFT_1130214 [Mycena rosella]|uniref:Uncharacterized protein n=1 Tax=Mycena rosella TaxID=1033263 RepID=A0AAD7DQU7_MYCRO|nr:hypothetical protein B0H17DRAFT_1130214 [Mycena rosella]
MLPPYAPPPPAHPLKSTLSYDYLSGADEICIKRWLSNRLRDPRSGLPHMPGGFPFHYSVDGRGRGSLSYEPYEFCEEIPSSVLHWADLPGPVKHGASSFTTTVKPYMSWRAYVAVRDMSDYRSDLLNLPLLHVELDPTVLNTSYGHLLKNDPTVVLRAMGVSLDKGLPITIKLAEYSHPKQILFFGTDQTRKRHLLHRIKLEC